MGVGRGYGKLLLFGEHAAVYRYPAVGIQLEQSLMVTADTAKRWSFPQLIPSAYHQPLVDALAEVLGYEPQPMRLTLSGELPVGVGFGSSAAFCSALLQAVEPDRFSQADRMVLWHAAHRLEHLFHGTPSGIDTGLSIHPGAHALFPTDTHVKITVAVRVIEPCAVGPVQHWWRADFDRVARPRRISPDVCGHNQPSEHEAPYENTSHANETPGESLV